MSKLIRELMDAINAVSQNKTQPYDRQGEVKRIDGKIAWVKLEGSDRETPIQMTIACDVGDTVQARIGGGSAWLTGNLTAPPTDDKKANQAITMVTNVKQEITEVVEEAMDEIASVDDVTVQYCLSTSSSTFIQDGDWSNTPPAYQANRYYWTRTVIEDEDGNEVYGTPQYSQDTQLSVETDVAFKSNNNHFWHDSSGAYVTTADKDYESGYATRITSSGILQSYNNYLLSAWTGSGISFYAGNGTTVSNSTSTASFGSSAARIGPLVGTNITLSSSYGINMNVRNSTGTSYVSAVDIGYDSSDGYEDTQNFPKGLWYTFGYRAGTSAQRGYYSFVNGFNNIAAHNASAAFGIDNSVYAPMAMAIGMNNVIGSSSYNSKNSYLSTVPGRTSVAIGYGLNVSGATQLVIGVYNYDDTSKMFIIGNGYSSSSRSNVFTVDGSGNVAASGSITAQGHSSAIGTIKTNSSSPSMASSTSYANITSVSLETGTWLVTYACYCDMDTADKRLGARLSDGSTDYNSTRAIAHTVSGAALSVTGSAPISFSSTTTIYLTAFQNSGSSKTISGYLRAVRIA